MELSLTIKAGNRLYISTNHEEADLVIQIQEPELEAAKIELTRQEVQILRATLDVIYGDCC